MGAAIFARDPLYPWCRRRESVISTASSHHATFICSNSSCSITHSCLNRGSILAEPQQSNPRLMVPQAKWSPTAIQLAFWQCPEEKLRRIQYRHHAPCHEHWETLYYEAIQFASNAGNLQLLPISSHKIFSSFLGMFMSTEGTFPLTSLEWVDGKSLMTWTRCAWITWTIDMSRYGNSSIDNQWQQMK